MGIAYDIKKAALRALRFLLGETVAKDLAELLTKPLVDKLRDELTDELLEGLLRGMDVWAALSKGFRHNLDHWEGDLVLSTRHNDVAVTARFRDGDMQVLDDPVSDYSARVEFQDGDALRRYFLSDEQDILESVLRNEVTVEGNLNHVYRFGFLARDLMVRLTGHP